MRVNRALVYSLTFIAVILLGTCARFIYLGVLPPPLHSDEAFMTSTALAILNKSRPLLDSAFSVTAVGNILTAVFIKLLGFSVVAVRLPAVIYGVATNIFLYLLVKDMFDRKTALIACILGSFSHIAIAYSRMNLPNIQAPFLFVSVIYFLNLGLVKNNRWLLLIAGALAGVSLYSYTAAKIIIGLAILFAVFNWRLVKLKTAVFFIAGFLILALPLAINLKHPDSNYLKRENEVSLFKNPQPFFEKYNTDSIPAVIVKQMKINLDSFTNRDDYSNQYGNGPVLDKITDIFLFLFLILLYPYMVLWKNGEIRNIHFFVISFLLIFLLISLTADPPLSNRLLILYPMIVLFAALGLVNFNNFVMKGRAGAVFVVLMVAAICFINLKLYFYDFTNQHNAYYDWIEPDSSIGFRLYNSSLQNVGLISNPKTMSTQPILSVFTALGIHIQNLRSVQDIDNYVKSTPQPVFIIPLVPDLAIKESIEESRYVLDHFKEPQYKKAYYEGIPCKKCKPAMIYMTVTKTS